MQQHELNRLFDQQAAAYDQQWARTAAIRECLHFLLDSVFAGLPADARILCVGAGTGAEIAHLARVFPGWRFMALDPSGAMLDVCRKRAQAEGILARCSFHEGYVDALPAAEAYDGATCFLVSQFILEPQARVAFFHAIARRLKPGALLASSDLAAEQGPHAFDALLPVWFNMMSQTGMTPEALGRMRTAYTKDVAVLPPATVAALIESAGFDAPVEFFQAGLIHAWFSRRKPAL